MSSRKPRTAWVSYLRVSTPDQAERDLSRPAQRSAVDDYARRRGASIRREYLEPGASGANPQRPEFRRMLEDAFKPGSDILTIVVHHTSRFTRDATQARVVKTKLAKAGVRVLSVCQELQEDPTGKLMEGIFECIDQYESEINGMRTAAAMREAIRQGFFPGAIPPYGFQSRPVELRPGLVRHLLVPHDDEAEVVREIFRLYVAENGAKAVARALNRRGLRYRTGAPWDKKLVMGVLDQPAVAGSYRWGRQINRPQRRRTRTEVIELKVTRIVEPDVFDLVQKLRTARDPKRTSGRAASPTRLLSGLIRCGRCGASYQLETSGKRIDDGVYRYCYYNCRSACRGGKELCGGFRIPTATLDVAVLEHLAAIIGTPERAACLIDDLTRTREQSLTRERDRLQNALQTTRDRVGEWNVALTHSVSNEALARTRLGSLHDRTRHLEQQLARVQARGAEAREQRPDANQVAETWRLLITHDPNVGRAYLLHLIERVNIFGERVVLTAKSPDRASVTEGC